MKKLLQYLKLKLSLSRRMTIINETLALKDMVDIYAENVCKMNNWDVHVGSGLSFIFCDISLAFMNGYIKALRDNGLEFQNGLVRKREIAYDMPIGALKHYDEKVKKSAIQDAIVALRKVLENYGEPQSNINTIVSAFEDTIYKKK